MHAQLLNFKGWQSRQHKNAAFKLHVAWNIEGEWVEEFRITNVCCHDGGPAKEFTLEKGKIYVADRAYFDVQFWLKILNKGSHFVTRIKRSSRLTSVHEQSLNADDLNKDGVILERKWFASEDACYRAKVPLKSIYFRHIIYRDPETRKLFDFITSDWEQQAQAIADFYKKRWSVELFFKWIKTHFQLRVLDLRCPNTVRIYASMIVLTQVLLQLLKTKTEFKGTTWEYLRMLRIHLFKESLLLKGDAAHEVRKVAHIKDLAAYSTS